MTGSCFSSARQLASLLWTFATIAVFGFTASAGIGIITDFSGRNGEENANQFPGSAGDGWASGWRQNRPEDIRTVETDQPFDGDEPYLLNRIRQEDWESDSARACRITRRYADSPTRGIDRTQPHTIEMQIRLDQITSDFSHSREWMEISGHHPGIDGPTWRFRMAPYNHGRDPIQRVRWQFFNGDGDGGSQVITLPVPEISGEVGTIYKIRLELDPAANKWDAEIGDGNNQIRLSQRLQGEALGFQHNLGEAGGEIRFNQLFRGANNDPIHWSLNYLAIIPEPGVRLVSNRQPQATIVLDDQPEFSARYAAIMLNRYLQQSTGAELEIVHAGELESDTLDPARNWVLLGNSRFTRQLGITVEDKPYGGFVIIAEPGDSQVEAGRIVENGGILAIVGLDYPILEGIDGRADAARDDLVQNSDSGRMAWRTQRLNLDGDYIGHYWNSGGTLYGVIHFLRHQMGVRWLWPGETGTVVPDHSVVSAVKQHFEDEPAMGIRWIRNHLPQTLKNTYEEDEWWRGNLQGKALRFRANHAFNAWKDRFFDEHPEYFGWQPHGETREQPRIQDKHWKVCPSEPGVIDQIVADARQTLEQNPHWWTVSVSQGDAAATGNCFCDKCLEFDRQLKAEHDGIPTVNYSDGKTGERFTEIINTDRHVAWWNRIAERIEETHPDRFVASWAYGPYSRPPVRERVRDNIIVGFVGFGWVTPTTEARRQWDQWATKAPNLLLRPNALHQGFAFPHNYSRKMVEDMRKNFESGMIGAEFDSLMGHWANQGLIYYVLAHSMWDPYLDVDALIDDFCETGFGPAAVYMREYFDLLEQITDRYRQVRATSSEQGSSFPADDYVALLEEELDADDQGALDSVGPGEGPLDLAAAPNWIARRVQPREAHRLYGQILMNHFDRLAGSLSRARAAVLAEDPAYRKRIDFIEQGLFYAFLEADVLVNWYELPREEVFAKIDRRNKFLDEIQDTHVINVQRIRNRHGRYAMNKSYFDHEQPYRTNPLD